MREDSHREAKSSRTKMNYSKPQSTTEPRSSILSMTFNLFGAFLKEYTERGNVRPSAINPDEADSSIEFTGSINTTFLGAIEAIKSGKSYAVNTEAIPHVKS